jgi:hypothetical protein
MLPIFTAAELDHTALALSSDTEIEALVADMEAALADGQINLREFLHCMTHARRAHDLLHEGLSMSQSQNRAYEAMSRGHAEQVPVILRETQL